MRHPELQRALDLIDSATDGMTDDQLAWRPEGKWSTATILEHLSLTFSGTAKGLNRVLAAGKIDCRERTLKERVLQFALLSLSYFPEGRKAPPRAVPSETMPGQQAMREIREKLAAMDSAMAACAEKFSTNQQILEHPILGPLSLAQWEKFHWLHTRHHMKQVRERRLLSAAQHAAVGAR
jgi:hypothetical protein